MFPWPDPQSYLPSSNSKQGDPWPAVGQINHHSEKNGDQRDVDAEGVLFLMQVKPWEII